MRKLFFLISIVFVFSGCSKTEGEGGLATIYGKVNVLDYNSDFTILKDDYYAADEDVFIVYGDDSIYSDDFETDYTGTFRFQNLRKGTYTVYALSKDSTGTFESGYIPVKEKIE
ncbi:MAG: membrane lipoprotein lipid attachment site-containing protein, partial [Bacteroidales bacterium]|nr:membrane lipoprotein lipid attachment site-containing protein [Bacteroidales bacterium]